MIRVLVDFRDASPAEIEAFFALSGVGRAIDTMAVSGLQAGVALSVVTPAPRVPRPPLLDPVH